MRMPRTVRVHTWFQNFSRAQHWPGSIDPRRAQKKKRARPSFSLNSDSFIQFHLGSGFGIPGRHTHRRVTKNSQKNKTKQNKTE